jgi:hypothetical protein
MFKPGDLVSLKSKYREGHHSQQHVVNNLWSNDTIGSQQKGHFEFGIVICTGEWIYARKINPGLNYNALLVIDSASMCMGWLNTEIVERVM